MANAGLVIAQKPCAPSNYRKGRHELKPLAIVIHISDGLNAKGGVDEWFNNPKAGVSAHYLVQRDGTVHQYVQEEDEAYHAGVVNQPTWETAKTGPSPNLYTIGIEHEGTGDISITDEQYATSALLIATVAKRWGFAVGSNTVIPHHAINAGHSCPANAIDMAALITKAQASTGA
jgi:N-acetylmuramoyl-L-alanine amidase